MLAAQDIISDRPDATALRVGRMGRVPSAPRGLDPDTPASPAIAGRSAADSARIARVQRRTVPVQVVLLASMLHMPLPPAPSSRMSPPVADTAPAVPSRPRHLPRAAMPVAHPAAGETSPVRITGLVGTSLWSAARAAGAPPGALADYLRAIAAHAPIDGIAPGDRFDLVIAPRAIAANGVSSGDLLYAGLDQPGNAVHLIRWEGGWVDPARAAASSPLLLPVAGRLSSGFGQRLHPLLGFTRLHAGIDLAAPAGAPIVAAADGVVRFAGWHGGHGQYVRLDHGAGLETGYGHMSRIAVAPGTRVRRGEVIGAVGSTGLSTGPHCHFELFRAGVPVDPLGARAVVAPPVDPRIRARMQARLAWLTALPRRG